MLPEAVSSLYRAQQRLTVATLALTRREWASMGDDFDASWQRIGPRLTLLTASAQVGAARNGSRMVPNTLDELGQAVRPEGLVDAAAFAGYASDGRPLDSLLYGAVTTAKEARTAHWGHDDRGATTYLPGLSVTDALAKGRSWLDMAVHTQVSDAGRQAAGVGIYARPGVGYVRAANPPCCQRCAVLSGKFSRAEEPFNRHPHCDCINIPTTDPRSITAPVIGPDDVKDLTIAQRKAIGDGADFNQVINAHRAGARSKNGLTTTEGATRRGIAGKALGAERGKRAARLTPEGIYRIASDRAEALRLLKAHGYLL